MRNVSRLDQLDEFVDAILVAIPEHGADQHSIGFSGSNGRRDVRIPKVDYTDTAGIGEEMKPQVIFQSPSNADLSATCGSVGWGRGRGRNGARRLGARRGRTRWGIISLGSAGWGRGAGRPGLASFGITFLLGNAVMVWKMPSQAVRVHRERKGLGWGEGAKEGSECGQRKDVEKLDGMHLFKGRQREREKKRVTECLGQERRRRREEDVEGKGDDCGAGFYGQHSLKSIYISTG